MTGDSCRLTIKSLAICTTWANMEGRTGEGVSTKFLVTRKTGKLEEMFSDAFYIRTLVK